MALKDAGIPFEAQVESVSPDIHNTFKYSFVVDNKKYEGVSQIIDVAPKLGEKVAISYLPASPDFNYAGDIRAQIDNDLISAVLASVILPSFIVALNLHRSRARENRNNER
jgi:hypothetical protein